MVVYKTAVLNLKLLYVGAGGKTAAFQGFEGTTYIFSKDTKLGTAIG